MNISSEMSGKANTLRNRVGILLISSWLTACSSGGGVREVGDPIHKTTLDTDNCVTHELVQQQVEWKEKDSEEAKRALIDKVSKRGFDTNCGDFRVVMALAKKADWNTPEGGMIASSILLGLAGENRDVRSFLQNAMVQNDWSEEMLQKSAMKDEVRGLATRVHQPYVSVDYEAYIKLRDLYFQDDVAQNERKYAVLSPDVIRKEIDRQLAKTGQSMEQVSADVKKEQAMLSPLFLPKEECKNLEGHPGVFMCEPEQEKPKVTVPLAAPENDQL